MSNEMMITETGLDLSNVDLHTDEGKAEFYEDGRKIAKMEGSLMFAKGDWYNALDDVLITEDGVLPTKEDKKRACESVGIRMSDITVISTVAKSIAPENRFFLGWNRSKSIVYGNVLPEKDLPGFIQQCIDNDWTAEQIATKKDLMLGVSPKEAKKIDRKSVSYLGKKEMIEAEIASMPERHQRKVGKLMDKVLDMMHIDFLKEVGKEVKVEKERLQAEYEQKTADIAEMREKANKLQWKLINQEKALEANKPLKLWTYEEFKLIRGCLHPDKREAVSHERLAKAFDIFGRYIDYMDSVYAVNKRGMVEAGWEDYKPRRNGA